MHFCPQLFQLWSATTYTSNLPGTVTAQRGPCFPLRFSPLFLLFFPLFFPLCFPLCFCRLCERLIHANSAVEERIRIYRGPTKIDSTAPNKSIRKSTVSAMVIVKPCNVKSRNTHILTYSAFSALFLCSSSLRVQSHAITAEGLR